jgi:hypothetical protein
MAGVAALFWGGTPLLFFKREIRRWWRTRDVRRLRAAEAARNKAEAEARLRDELAAKYPLPVAPRTPKTPS